MNKLLLHTCDCPHETQRFHSQSFLWLVQKREQWQKTLLCFCVHLRSLVWGHIWAITLCCRIKWSWTNHVPNTAALQNTPEQQPVWVCVCVFVCGSPIAGYKIWMLDRVEAGEWKWSLPLHTCPNPLHLPSHTPTHTQFLSIRSKHTSLLKHCMLARIKLFTSCLNSDYWDAVKLCRNVSRVGLLTPESALIIW